MTKSNSEIVFFPITYVHLFYTSWHLRKHMLGNTSENYLQILCYVGIYNFTDVNLLYFCFNLLSNLKSQDKKSINVVV